MSASTSWQEQIADGEEARFSVEAEWLAGEQAKRTQRQGKGRALHRRQILGLRGSLEVLPSLPGHAAHGLFASARRYDVRVRLSNGSFDKKPDRAPDVRGFAIKVLGVDGESVFGGPAASQDFLLINRPVFGFERPEPFFDLLHHAVRGPLSVVGHMVRQHGFFGGLRRLAALQKDQSAPFFGFGATTFFSAAPIACGPYAVRVRLVPEATPSGAVKDFAADMTARLSVGDLRYALELQFFVDEAHTPIENGAVAWPEGVAPFVRVATLLLPTQDPASVEGRALGDEVEALKLDPWSALAAHRPLGAIMRARKIAYLASQKARGVA
jgi:hypothetical protein